MTWEGTATDNRMVRSLPPLCHQLLGPVPLVPTTYTLSPSWVQTSYVNYGRTLAQELSPLG